MAHTSATVIGPGSAPPVTAVPQRRKLCVPKPPSSTLAGAAAPAHEPGPLHFRGQVRPRVQARA